ncbi:MAG: [protein-PII] uridylyltransferase [Planctomycetaceae bacterium]|nr:[protein-PII] uridylyltransferase [Planctomycetaceae bacterium]
MSAGLRLNSTVVAARQRLVAGREKLRRQHDSGSPGVQVCAHLTDLLESIVLDLFQTALDDLDEPSRKRLAGSTALLAHSGFGRREMAPFSDIDVMLLHPFRDEALVPLVRRFTQHLYDLALDVGFSARTPAQACALAFADATVLTSLTECRLIGGNEELYEQFDGRFRRMTRRRRRRLLTATEAARRDERAKYGETVFLLEPNVKRSRGGLRDLQFIRWIGFIRYGENEFDGLRQAGWLTADDERTLRRARDYLLWLRNDLHFAVGKASDLLDRTEQLRLSEARNYAPLEGLLPVEQFMREYFQHTTAVREIASNFAAGARPRSVWSWLTEPLFSHEFEGDFRIGPTSISLTRQGLAKIGGDLAEVLRLLDLANYANKRIDHRTWQTIRTAMKERGPADPAAPLPPEVCERFLSLLSQPPRLAESLRKLHELRVLEQIVPAFTHARGLLQFNAYHRFTVDEHSLQVVDELTSLQHEAGTPGEVYRSLRNKGTLHLAALIHDLGKGYVEDHSEVGLRIAEQLAARLHLPEQDAEMLKFLVHKHLRMSHLAQQHDIQDINVVVQFAVEVGSPERLKMLYVLTLADLAGVGPGVLNQWKRELLTDLYRHALDLLTSESPADAASQRLRSRREEILSLARRLDGVAWWETQVVALPASCMFAGPPRQIVEELERLRKLPHRDAVAWGRHLPERNATEYTVGTYEEITPGIFHKLTGALTSHRQQILSADINTLAEGMVLDRFYVEDQDFAGTPPPERQSQICSALVASLKDASGSQPAFRKLWQERSPEQSAAIQHLPTRVTIDNNTAERFTIVAVFAYDRMGLLYAVARALFELGLSVSKAKIGTHLDQVVDVFYVTDQTTGAKITGDQRLADIRKHLLAAIEALETK